MKKADTLWKTGRAGVYDYWVKSYDEGSCYGINEGRISKLELRLNGRIVAGYDRGWWIHPIDSAARAAVAELVAKYN